MIIIKYSYKGALVYFDATQKLIGVPSGEWRGGTKGLDIYLILEPGYDDNALEKFIIDTLDMCYTKKATDNGPAAIEKYTNKKSYNIAVRGFRTFSFGWKKDEGYGFTPSIASKEYKGSFVSLWDSKIVVPTTYQQGALAKAFRQAMAITSQDDYQCPVSNIPKQTFTLLCDKEVSYSEPQNDNIINAEDYGVAEIYQGYTYVNNNGISVAEFYYSIASELDCDISPDNIRKKWEHLHGKAKIFGVTKTNISVFTHRIEFQNNKKQKISYIIQLNEYELFACELEIMCAKVSKPLHSKLTKLFENLAQSTSFAVHCKQGEDSLS